MPTLRRRGLLASLGDKRGNRAGPRFKGRSFRSKLCEMIGRLRSSRRARPSASGPADDSRRVKGITTARTMAHRVAPSAVQPPFRPAELLKTSRMTDVAIETPSTPPRCLATKARRNSDSQDLNSDRVVHVRIDATPVSRSTYSASAQCEWHAAR